jgi:hypothetical protein
MVGEATPPGFGDRETSPAATIPAMTRATARWAFYLGAALAVGPLAGALTGSLRGIDGSSDASLLIGASPALGVAAGLGVFLLAAAIALPAARLFGAGPGLVTAGLVIAWGAWRTASAEDLVRLAPGGGTAARLAVEGVFAGVVGAALVRAIDIGSRRREAKRAESGTGPALGAIGLGLLCGAIVAHLLGVEALRGQAVVSAIAAGIAAGRLVDPGVRLLTVFTPMALLGVLSPLLLIVGTSEASLAEAVNRGSLPHLSMVLPMDWIAGAFLGTPLGVAWAASMTPAR